MRQDPELASDMAPPAPPCFSSRDQWLAWVESAAMTGRGNERPLILKPGQPVRFNTEIDFCADCSKQHRSKMIAENRCDPIALRPRTKALVPG